MSSFLSSLFILPPRGLWGVPGSPGGRDYPALASAPEGKCACWERNCRSRPPLLGILTEASTADEKPIFHYWLVFCPLSLIASPWITPIKQMLDFSDSSYVSLKFSVIFHLCICDPYSRVFCLFSPMTLFSMCQIWCFFVFFLWISKFGNLFINFQESLLTECFFQIWGP